MMQELMVCHVNSQITRGIFVFTQLSSIFVEILLPYLLTQNLNYRELRNMTSKHFENFLKPS